MTTANELLAADQAFLWNLERQSPGLHIAGLARVEGGIERNEVLQQVWRLRRLRSLRTPRGDHSLRVPALARGALQSGATRSRCRKPATRPLRSTTALTKPLDPSRPLWEVHLLPGHHDSGDALLVKTHLAAVDGLGTNDLFDVLFDTGARNNSRRSGRAGHG